MPSPSLASTSSSARTQRQLARASRAGHSISSSPKHSRSRRKIGSRSGSAPARKTHEEALSRQAERDYIEMGYGNSQQSPFRTPLTSPEIAMEQARSFVAHALSRIPNDEMEDVPETTLAKSPASMRTKTAPSPPKDQPVGFMAGKPLLRELEKSPSPLRLHPSGILCELYGLYADSVGLLSLLPLPGSSPDMMENFLATLATADSHLSAQFSRLADWILKRAESFTNHLYIDAMALVQTLFAGGIPMSPKLIPAFYRPDELVMVINLAIYIIHILRINHNCAGAPTAENSHELPFLLAPSDAIFPRQFVVSKSTVNVAEDVGSTDVAYAFLEHGLELRTQLAISQLRSIGDTMLDADTIINSLFCSPESPPTSGKAEGQRRLREWPLAGTVAEMEQSEGLFQTRIMDIRQFCSLDDQNDDDDDDMDEEKDDEDVNIEGLEQQFPWPAFVMGALHLARLRFDEITRILRARGGADRIIEMLKARESLEFEIERANIPNALFFDHPLVRLREYQNIPADIQAKLYNSPAAIAKFGTIMSSLVEGKEQPTRTATYPRLSVSANTPTPASTYLLPNPTYARPDLAAASAGLIRLSRTDGVPLPSEAQMRPLPRPHRLIDPQQGAERISFTQTPMRGSAEPPSRGGTGYAPFAYSPSSMQAHLRVDMPPVSGQPPTQPGHLAGSAPQHQHQHPQNQHRRVSSINSHASHDVDLQDLILHQPGSDSDSDNAFEQAAPRRRGTMPGRVGQARPPSFPLNNGHHLDRGSPALGDAAGPYYPPPLPPQGRAGTSHGPYEGEFPAQPDLPGSTAPSRRGTSDVPRQPRRRWSQEEENALARYIQIVGGSYWAEIKRRDEEEGQVLACRSQVDLKDKARNMRLAIEKRGDSLPPGFETVTLKAKQLEMLEALRATQNNNNNNNNNASSTGNNNGNGSQEAGNGTTIAAAEQPRVGSDRGSPSAPASQNGIARAGSGSGPAGLQLVLEAGRETESPVPASILPSVAPSGTSTTRDGRSPDKSDDDEADSDR